MAQQWAARLYLHNDWMIRIRLSTTDPVTSLGTPLDGATVTGLLSATAGGAAIDPTLSITLAEGAAGDYAGTIPAADLAAHLATSAGAIIYERVTTADGAFDESRPLLVTDPKIGD